MPKSVIITCTNFGASHSANSAIYEILETKLATSASLMVPCPWSRSATKSMPRIATTDMSDSKINAIDVGVQLTLNAECESYRWGPITQSASLLDGDGGFPRTLTDLWEHADPEEVRRECRSQIERAVLWGLEVSHLGSHLDALLPRPEYFDIYLELAREFKLPLRLPEKSSEAEYGFPFRELADQAGVLAPDYTIQLTGKTNITDLVAELHKASLTEILCSPLIDTPEAQAIHPETFEDSISIKEKLVELSQAFSTTDIQLTSWRELASKN